MKGESFAFIPDVTKVQSLCREAEVSAIVEYRLNWPYLLSSLALFWTTGDRKFLLLSFGNLRGKQTYSVLKDSSTIKAIEMDWKGEFGR